MIARTHSSFLRSSITLCAAAMVFALTPSAALAQSDEIGADVRRTPQLTQDQAEIVTKFVKDHSTNLGSDNPQLVKRDRIALLAPLADPQASPAFRLRFSEALAPLLGDLATSVSEIVVINSLVIAGDLATAQGVDVLIEGLASAKPSVRYQAAFGFRRTFESLASMTTPTMRPDQAESGIVAVTEQIAKESDSLVIDGLVFAATEASRAPGLRSAALTHLGNSLSVKIKSHAGILAPEALTQAYLRAGAAVRDALTASDSGQISPESMKAATAMAGQIIAYCVQAVEAKALPSGDKGSAEAAIRETHAQLATTAENVLLLAVTYQGGAAPAARKIGDKLKTGSTSADASFSEDARALVGKDGLLTKEPFKFASDAFLSK
ncbi:MAG: hypothetical protein NTV94_20010 [Planctomycetota bacterium]|nr:hypothetical protein [Planctomycetota bacterium]